jgi:para-nitrobenzyl esterase
MIVNTKDGQVQGVQEGNLCVFRGIPYAAPTIGERRFGPPCPPQPWEGVLQAGQFGQVPFQPVDDPGQFPYVQSEDCLNLNIWTPSVRPANRPVLVDIHGGGFTSGTGAYFTAFTFAERDNIVCVSINYRLGALGFLYLGDLLGEDYRTSGNSGILDIVMALKWVKENIAAFGGDPNRITVSGGSAGAKCASTLLTVPAAQGLFHQLITRSGATQAIRDTQTASQLTLRLLDKLGIPHHEAHRLLTLPAQDILQAQDNGLHTFGPVRDGIVVSMAPINEVMASLNHKIPLLIGSNVDEAALFVTLSPEQKEPSDEVMYAYFGKNSGLVRAAYRQAALLLPAKEALSRTLSDYLYRIATIRLAEMAADQGHPVWHYRFEFTNGLGAIHGLDIPFIVNSQQGEVPSEQEIAENPMVHLLTFPSRGQELADAMHASCATFIHTGRPYSELLTEWPLFTSENRQTMVFNEKSVVEREPELQDSQFPNGVILL